MAETSFDLSRKVFPEKSSSKESAGILQLSKEWLLKARKDTLLFVSWNTSPEGKALLYVAPGAF